MSSLQDVEEQKHTTLFSKVRMICVTAMNIKSERVFQILLCC